MNKELTFSIVIVTRNRFSLLVKCIESIQATPYKNHEVIIVDNCSDDGTRSWLKENTNIHSILLNSNLGGSYAYNRGIQEALRLENDYILLLDDDSYLDNNCLSELAKALNKNRLNYAACEVLTYDGVPNMNNQTIIRDNKIYKSTFVGLCIKLDVVQKYGLPFKNLFRFYDDIEYVFRMFKIKGLKSAIVSSAVVYHLSLGKPRDYHFTNFNLSNHSNFFVRNDNFVRKLEYGALVALRFSLLVLMNKHEKFKIYPLSKRLQVFYHSLQGLFFIGKE